eukprot:1285649-Amphidinium_carterae.2
MSSAPGPRGVSTCFDCVARASAFTPYNDKTLVSEKWKETYDIQVDTRSYKYLKGSSTLQESLTRKDSSTADSQL